MNTKYKYYAQHMHMHSCYQPGASMEGHMYHANKLGMKYIWFTDHDNRMGHMKNEVPGFDFEGDELLVRTEDGRFWGFQPMEGSEAVLTKKTSFKGTQSMYLCHSASEGEWVRSGVNFISSKNNRCKSLLADVCLGIALKTDCTDWNDTRIIFDVRLSQRPPEHEPGHLYFVIGNADDVSDRVHTAVIPLGNYEGWHPYQLNLTEAVLCEEAKRNCVGGLDNAFDSFSIYLECRNHAGIKVWVDNFTIQTSKNSQETYETQKIVAREIGVKYGITPFVGMEISEAGPHKNCFSGHVPVVPYETLNYQVSHEEACEWVRDHQGVFSLNHPFAGFKRVDIHSLDLEYETEKIAGEFIHHKCWGAKLIEVGFPNGRYLPLQNHLKLWDLLAMNGQFLTGYGSSDNHSNQTDWYEGNNFASWIGVDERITEPKEEDFVASMKAGRIYTGNPVYIKDCMNFETESHASMGSIVMVSSEKKECARFTYDDAKAGWKVKWIRSGKVIRECVTEKGVFEDSCMIEHVHDIEPVRIELYDADDVCILLTNPIYFCEKKTVNSNLPMERLFVDSIRDNTMLLHIGDTHSETYDWYRNLIEVLKPDKIIHTGDMADEVKAGRMPEKKDEYCDKVSMLLDILTKTSCESCIVPGNNDLPMEIKRISPDIDMIEPDTVVNMEGCRICLSHEKRHITKTADIFLYGHSERDEIWDMSKNTRESEIWYLNSLWGVFLLSLPERILYFWERPEYAAKIWP